MGEADDAGMPSPQAYRAGAGEPLVAIGGPLTAAERARYARQIALPDMGEAGQSRLTAARVLVVGAGGLGSPAALYLAAAGFGTIGLVDDDTVDVANLQRQVAHGTPDVGRPKTASAADRLRELNPLVEVVEHRTRLRADNAAELVAAYDLVLDGSDNFGTRYLVNDACAFAGVPDVWASVLAFDAQVSVWWAGHGPCYRCVFPEPPPEGSVASCATAGVLGAVCGVAASLQVAEAVKLVVGAGEPLLGRITLYDALRGESRALPVDRDPSCALCGDRPTITGLQEVQDCARPPLVGEVEPAELAARLAGNRPPVVLDVREAHERVRGRIAGSMHLPLGAVRAGAYAAVLDRSRPVVVQCAVGARSAVAAAVLAEAGYDASNLVGGLMAWARDGLPVETGLEAPTDQHPRAARG